MRLDRSRSGLTLSCRRSEARRRLAQQRQNASEILREIHARTGLATISLGWGPHADVQFLFTSDICGESERQPRHARAYADLATLHRQIEAERGRALTEFRHDVAQGAFPEDAENIADRAG